MNPTDHPTIDRIADLQEGLLSAAEAAEVREHVEMCADCGETAAALAGVPEVLRAAADETATIPADVADRVRLALDRAAAERAADVPSLTERRAGRQANRRRHAHRWVLGAAAAAAAVVVFGGAVNMLGGDDDDGGAATAEGTFQADSGQEDAAGERPTARPTSEGALQGAPPPGPLRINPGEVRADAAALTSGFIEATSPRGACALLADDAGDHVLVSQYGTGPRAALLLVDEAQGTFRLVDCATGGLVTRGTL